MAPCQKSSQLFQQCALVGYKFCVDIYWILKLYLIKVVVVVL